MLNQIIKHLKRAFFLILALSVILILVCFAALLPLAEPGFNYPGGASFALAICDDTDDATLENIKPVYDFLLARGIRPTKTVWVYPADRNDPSYSKGDSLERIPYRDYMLELQRKNVEIALHGVRGSSSIRPIVLEGMELYRDTFKAYPKIHINHRANRDNLYWGSQRLTLPIFRWLHRMALTIDNFEGELADSEYYWGDIAQSHITSVNDLSFSELDLSKLSSSIPYHDASKEYVNSWFHTSDGAEVNAFNKLLSDENLDEIEKRGGYSIIYTHFGKRFATDGKLNSLFVNRVEALVGRNVWITTSSELLAFLAAQRSSAERSNWDHFRIELRWVIEKIYYGSS